MVGTAFEVKEANYFDFAEQARAAAALNLQKYVGHRPLTRHPEWFDPEVKLTLDMLRSDEEIFHSPGFAYFEKVFAAAPAAGEDFETDQDPKTMLNFFRANFMQKILLASDLAAAVSEVRTWLGDDAPRIKEAVDELRQRVGIRKGLDAAAKMLILQLEINRKRKSEITIPRAEAISLPRQLTEAEVVNYELRIAEAQEMALMQMEEVERGFAIGDLYLAYMLQTEGDQVSEPIKERLVGSVLKEFASPPPTSTPSVRAEEFTSKSLAEATEYI